MLSCAAALGACRPDRPDRPRGEPLGDRPAAPLDSLGVASDARVDSAGRLVGSFVGEGTSRAVHLLSSDTGFIAALMRRYRPDLARARDPWAALEAARAAPLDGARRRPEARHAAGPGVESAVVGSPLGHTEVQVTEVLLRGGRRGCGPRGAQAELVVADDRMAGDPPLRGPVLGSLRTGVAAERRAAGLVRRDTVAAPSAALVDELVGRTGRALDAALGALHQAPALRADSGTRIEINTLADVDAADVVAFRAGKGAVRYAVSLRVRRIAAGDTLVAAGVMVWDSAGTWRQTIFRPGLLALRGGRLEPYGSPRRPLYWRRLQPISDFAFPRDNLWMEQVDVRDGTVLWGIVQPEGNVIVAAAEVNGPCR